MAELLEAEPDAGMQDGAGDARPDSSARRSRSFELQTMLQGPDDARDAHPHHSPRRRRHRIAGLGRDAHADVRPLGGAARLRGRDARPAAGGRGRHQVGLDRDQGRVRLRLPQGGEGRAPAGADLAVRLAGPAPHLVRLGVRLSRHRRHHRDRPARRGHQDGRLPRLGRRRPARQQDLLGGAAHAHSRPASWWPASRSGARARTRRPR